MTRPVPSGSCRVSTSAIEPSVVGVLVLAVAVLVLGVTAALASPVGGDDLPLASERSTQTGAIPGPGPSAATTAPPADPVPSDPVPSDPVPSEPVPSDPVPSDPVPSDPVPSDPVPSEPVPSAPVPQEIAATPAMVGSAPVRLRVPSIGVDSELMNLGLNADGSMEVPPGAFPAGWYNGAPTPGEAGSAIIAGHVDLAGQPGVFVDLRNVGSGDMIEVDRQDGSMAMFQVTRTERYAKDAFPTELVYGGGDHAGLRLITCGGAFDRQAGSYRDNIIVFAELIDSDRLVS